MAVIFAGTVHQSVLLTWRSRDRQQLLRAAVATLGTSTAAR